MTNSTYNLGSSASHLLHRAQQVAANKSAEALRKAGITLRQFSVLSAIAVEEGISQSKLVSMTGVDRSTLADMAARMETAKLIKRTQSKTDARAKSLALTATGRKALQKAMPGVLAADASLMELMGSRGSGFLKTLSTLTEEEAPAKPAKKAAPKKAAPKKAAAKKTVAKKTVAKKVAPKKVAKKSAPVKAAKKPAKKIAKKPVKKAVKKAVTKKKK